MSSSTAGVRTSPRDEGVERAPSLVDPAVLLVLGLTLVLQLVAWSALDGYQIADSVEYLERARSIVRHEAMVDSVSIRPIGFSAVLLPFFAIGDWLGLPDQRAVVWCTYLLQIALGLALVHRVVRVGAKLGGRACGLAAGVFVGANPLFLQYSAQAESGILSALCLAIGIERFLERTSFRRALVGGLWFGAGFLIAYKLLAIVLAVTLVLVARDRWKHRASWLAVAAGLGIAAVVQMTIDGAMYGRPGATLSYYLVSNFGGVTYSALHRLHLDSLAMPIYRRVAELQGREAPLDAVVAPGEYHGLQSRWWYFENLARMIVWPALVCAALGLARAIVRPRWTATILLAAFVVFALATSNKGSKDYRVWIPLLPALAPIAAWGLAWVVDAIRSPAWRRTVRVAVIAPSVVLGVAAFLALNTGHFGGYWRAIESANDRAHAVYAARAAASSDAPALAPRGVAAPRKVRVGAAYNWAVYMRDEPWVELVKLPHQLNEWGAYDQVAKGDDYAALEELDLFLVHHPILSTNPDLMEWVAAHFEVAELYYDRRAHADLGPLYLLVKRTGSARAATFFDVRSHADPDAFRAERELPPSADFVSTDGPGGNVERVVFLGYELRTLPPDGFGWLTYHWWTPTGVAKDLLVVDRITAIDERNTWQNDHRTAWGVVPTSAWKAGDLVSEGYPFVPATAAFAWEAPWRPIGGGYRRGDAIPVRLWMELVEPDPVAEARHERVIRSRFELARRGEATPVVAPGEEPPAETLDGIQFSGDGLARVGAFFVPVHPLAKVANDGRPIPD